MTDARPQVLEDAALLPAHTDALAGTFHRDVMPAPPSPTSETPLLDLLLLLIERRRLLILATLCGLLLGIVLALVMKPVYTATATIMPPQAPQSSLSSMLGQLGGLSTLGGAGGLLKNPSDLYVGILQSRTISDQAIEQFHLKDRWHAKTMTAARNALNAHAQFESEKSGLIQISVAEHSPQLASDLANYFVGALYQMNSGLAISEAGQRRLFFEEHLSEEKSALTQAEDDLKRIQQQTGLLTISGQTELAVRSIAQTRAQISAKEVELQSLQVYAAAENPDVIRVRGEIATLRSQLSGLENNQSRLAPGDTGISASQVPGGSLEYVRAMRNVRYHETLFDLLSRQYEAARIDEAKSAPIIQVVDRATPPDQKSGPPRTLIVLSASVAGFLLSCAYLLAKAWSKRWALNHGAEAKMQEVLRQYRLHTRKA